MDSGAVPLNTYTPTLNGSLWRTVWEGKDVKEGQCFFLKRTHLPPTQAIHLVASASAAKRRLRGGRVEKRNMVALVLAGWRFLFQFQLRNRKPHPKSEVLPPRARRHDPTASAGNRRTFGRGRTSRRRQRRSIGGALAEHWRRWRGDPSPFGGGAGSPFPAPKPASDVGDLATRSKATRPAGLPRQLV